MDTIIKKFDAMKLEHELPNKNDPEHNFGFVKAISIAIKEVKEYSKSIINNQLICSRCNKGLLKMNPNGYPHCDKCDAYYEPVE